MHILVHRNGLLSARLIAAYFLAILALVLVPAAYAGTSTVSGTIGADFPTTQVTNINGPSNAQQTSFTGYTGGGPYQYMVYPFTVSVSGVYTASSTTTHVVNTTWILGGIFSPSPTAPATPLSAFIVAVLSGGGNPATGNFTGFSLVAGQQYSVLVAFNIGSVPGDQSVFTMSGPGCIAFGTSVCETDPIPKLSGLPGIIPGLKNPLSVLDLSAGKGPAMVNCLVGTVRKLLGADATYVGQSVNGNASISQGGRIISFYPLSASLDASQSADIHLGGTNIQNIGTSCGNFNVVPALYNPGEFGATIAAMGLTAEMSTQGVITLATADGSVYVARPDYLVTPPSTPSAKPGFAVGADGLYRFTDSAGYTQVLRPTFSNTAALYARLSTNFGGGWMIYLTDGSILFTTIGGQQFVVTADVSLHPVPAANASSLFWQDGTNHYELRTTLLEYSQGYTQTPR